MTGTAIGLIVGGAYLVGGMAQAADQHARVSRLAAAADGSFSETALKDGAGGMDASALTIARRLDPNISAADAQRDHQLAVLSNQLEQKSAARADGTQPTGLVLRASFGSSFTPAAAPFRFGGALNASRDLECLTQAVYYEARGETPDGQAAVAQVVLNRVRHPAFPKSICGVVFQGAGSRVGCQFSFACDGSMGRGRETGAWTRASRVASKALGGYVLAAVGNATHFHTINVSPNWGPRLMRVSQVGLHVFYRMGGKAGAPDAFDATPRPSSAPPADLGQGRVYARVETSAPDDDVRLISADARVAPPVTEVSGGMGGPAGRTAEPASAPRTGDASAAARAKPPVLAPAGIRPPSSTPAAAS